MHLSTFLENLGFVLGALVLLGACGWFAVAPFRGDLRHAALAAPLAGILMLTMVTLAGYVFCKLPLRPAGLAGLGLTVGLSLLAGPWTRLPRLNGRGVLLLLLALGVSAAAVRLATATSLQFGGAALLYADGTDHLGYAHLADWLNNHPVTSHPVLDPRQPYESWPALLLQIDPRFGSHTFLALVAQASGHSAMFSYDLGTAVVLAATILAVAAVYARSALMLVVLVAGLFTCHWFDYGRTGYLGKILGFPSAFLVAGLYLRAGARTLRVGDVAALAALAAGAALMHSGLTVALFVGLVGGTCLLAGIGRGGPSRGWAEMREKAIALALILGAALLAAGTLARPLATGYPDWNLEWRYILPRIADLESQGVPVSGFSGPLLLAAAWCALAIGLGGGLLAVLHRVPAAIALLLGPLGLLAVLYAVNARAVAFQLIGVFYPLGLCGLAVLREELLEKIPAAAPAPVPARWPGRLVLILAVVAVALHVPRLKGALDRFGGRDMPAPLRFSEAQMNRLAENIGAATVDIDLPDAPQLNIAVLVELGRRGLPLQWQASSWQQIMAHQPWAVPVYPHAGRFRLVAAAGANVPAGAVVCRTEQYLLLRPEAAGTPP